MDKALFDNFGEQAAEVVQQLLTYAQLPAAERNEENEGQVRRLRGTCPTSKESDSTMSSLPAR